MAGPFDAWAVGASYAHAFDAGKSQTLIEHWNGREWQRGTSPSTIGDRNSLEGVVAVTSNDVWAVGYKGGTASVTPLVIHNDGTGWNEVSTGGLADTPALFSAVRAHGANSLWAVGLENRNGGARTALAARWDGTSWSRTGIDDAPPASWLVDVAIVDADDVWAVGTYSYFGLSAQLIEHWDGQTWTRATGDVRQGGLNGITVLSATDAWAVGYHDGSPDALHWDGSTWNAVPAPSAGTTPYDQLSSVAAVSANDIWAVGSYAVNSSRETHTLTEHWDGSTWTIVPSPTTSGWDENLDAVVIGAGGERWAVGGNELESFAIRRCDATPVATTITAYPVVASTPPSALTVRLTVAAKLQAHDVGVPDSSLDFDLGGGARCTATTNADGTASCTVDALPAAVLNGGYTVTFAGDQFHLPSRGQAGLVG